MWRKAGYLVLPAYKTLRPYIYLLLVGMIWSTTFPAMALSGLAPFMGVFMRGTSGLMLSLPFQKGQATADTKSKIWSFLLGSLNGLVFVMQILASQNTSSGRASTFSKTSLLFVIIIEYLIYRYFDKVTKPSRQQLLAVIIGTIGFAVLGGNAFTGGYLNIGDVWAIGSAITFSVYIVGLQILNLPISVLGIQLLAVPVVGLLGVLTELPVNITAEAIGYSLWLGVATAFPAWVFTRLPQWNFSSSRANLLVNIEIPLSFVVGYIIQKQIPTANDLIGSSILVVGIIIAAIPSGRAASR